MSGVAKLTTGLTGLAVHPLPHRALGALYTKILNVLGQMPSNAAYRKYTEQIICERVAIVNAEKDVEAVEKKIGCGQIEEVILQAEKELALARKMLAYKPWEPLIKDPPAVQWTWPPAEK